MSFKHRYCCDPFKTYKKQILKNLCPVPNSLVGTKSLTDTDLICTNCIINVKQYENYSNPNEPMLKAASFFDDENALMEFTNQILTLLKQTPIKQDISYIKLKILIKYKLNYSYLNSLPMLNF